MSDTLSVYRVWLHVICPGYRVWSWPYSSFQGHGKVYLSYKIDLPPL